MNLAQIIYPDIPGETYARMFSRLLRELTEESIPGDILEVGIGDGWTHRELHRHRGHRTVYGVDNFTGVDMCSMAELITDIYGWQSEPHIFVMYSRDVPRHLVDVRLALLFIDADHDYEAEFADLKSFVPILVQGGVLAVHDADRPEVERAIQDVAHGFRDALVFEPPPGNGQLMWMGVKR